MVWGTYPPMVLENKLSLGTIMDEYSYVNILKQNILDSAEDVDLESSYRFQQDSNPKHTLYGVRL